MPGTTRCRPSGLLFAWVASTNAQSPPEGRIFHLIFFCVEGAVMTQVMKRFLVGSCNKTGTMESPGWAVISPLTWPGRRDDCGPLPSLCLSEGHSICPPAVMIPYSGPTPGLLSRKLDMSGLHPVGEFIIKQGAHLQVYPIHLARETNKAQFPPESHILVQKRKKVSGSGPHRVRVETKTDFDFFSPSTSGRRYLFLRDPEYTGFSGLGAITLRVSFLLSSLLWPHGPKMAAVALDLPSVFQEGRQGSLSSSPHAGRPWLTSPLTTS